MKRCFYYSLPVLFVGVVCCNTLLAQSFNWTATNSPDPVATRFEDVFFLNADTGFAVHFGHPNNPAQIGYIMRTYDGGSSWQTVYDTGYCRLRDIAFTDAQHGFAGLLLHDNFAPCNVHLFQTSDGGNNWQGVVLPGPFNTGICGLRAINDSTVYAIGRYNGPTSFYRTTNNGQSWTYHNLDTVAKGLVDIFFFDKDTGFAVGFTGTQYTNGYARVLYTTNGGLNWQVVHTSPYQTSLGWKVVFPSRLIGYASLFFSNSSVPQYFLKTTNGGLTWQDIQITGSSIHSIEGMGFLNDTVGWMGGYGGTAFTSNGGLSWTTETWGSNLNRFRFLGDTLGYCAGAEIYKLEVPNCNSPAQFVSAAICSGQSYSFNSQLLSASGVYTATFQNAAGCDSTVTLNLQVSDTLHISISETICTGDSVLFAGSYLSASGTYNASFTSAAGCDSVVSLQLSVSDTSTTFLQANICTGDTFLFEGSSLTAAGVYTATLQNAAGCDSVVTLSLQVDAPTSATISATISSGQSYDFNGTLLTQSGTYTDTLTNTAGCDSVITLLLNVTTLVNEMQDADAAIRVWPNPVRDWLEVQMAEAEEGDVLEMMDMTGTTVYKTQINDKRLLLDVTNLPAGVYALTAGKTVMRVIK